MLEISRNFAPAPQANVAVVSCLRRDSFHICSKSSLTSTQRVGRSLALLFHGCDTRRGRMVSSTPRPHFTPGNDAVPIVQEAKGKVIPLQARCGPKGGYRHSSTLP